MLKYANIIDIQLFAFAQTVTRQTNAYGLHDQTAPSLYIEHVFHNAQPLMKMNAVDLYRVVCSRIPLKVFGIYQVCRKVKWCNKAPECTCEQSRHCTVKWPE
jgi:hypothetical protein